MKEYYTVRTKTVKKEDDIKHELIYWNESVMSHVHWTI